MFFLVIDSYSSLRTGLLEIGWIGEGFYDDNKMYIIVLTMQPDKKNPSKLLCVAWHHTSNAGDLVLFVFTFYLFCMMVIFTRLRDPGLRMLSDMTARRTAQLKANFQVDYFKFYDPASLNLI